MMQNYQVRPVLATTLADQCAANGTFGVAFLFCCKRPRKYKRQKARSLLKESFYSLSQKASKAHQDQKIEYVRGSATCDEAPHLRFTALHRMPALAEIPNSEGGVPNRIFEQCTAALPSLSGTWLFVLHAPCATPRSVSHISTVHTHTAIDHQLIAHADIWASANYKIQHGDEHVARGTCTCMAHRWVARCT